MKRDDRIDRALDAALEMTFPASDPIAVCVDEPRLRSAEPGADKTRERTSARGQRVKDELVAAIC